MMREAAIVDAKVITPGIRDAVMREAEVTKDAKVVFHTETPGHFDGTPSDGRITLKKATGHLMTVLTHKKLVAEGCFQVGLYRQGLLHDLSKFHPVELLNGFRYYQGGKQSPNNGERVEKGYSEAWMHHKGRNRHHFEYWTDYNTEAVKKGLNPVQPVKMPRKYVAEMLMDRIAASKNYMKENYTDASPLDYYERGKAAKMIHPETAKELEQMLRILKEKGEKEFYRFVKDHYLSGGAMEQKETD